MAQRKMNDESGNICALKQVHYTPFGTIYCLDGNHRIPLSASYPAHRRINPIISTAHKPRHRNVFSDSAMTLEVLDGFPSKPLAEIQRASYSLPSSIQNVSVNHSRSDIIMTQKFCWRARITSPNSPISQPSTWR